AAPGPTPTFSSAPAGEYPSPLTLPAAPSGFQALALCDFPSGAGVAAVLRMGEQLRILSEDGEWWLVVSEVSGKECHVPSSCVAKIRHGWLYEGLSRQKAEELLLRPGNHSGSFLIRESQSRRGRHSLSLRRGERAACASVTHYRIHRLENGWIYISPGLTFPSLHSLVEHYSEFSEGLCCPLTQPCSTDGIRAAPAPTPPLAKSPALHWDKIDSSLLLSENTSPQEESPFSPGLREAISSYLLLSESDSAEPEPTGKGAKNS
ncbi:SLAP2 protein, partial [Mionectes macconnelli]|nr:SLAP2 protein [Mionectes macconnelli]